MVADQGRDGHSAGLLRVSHNLIGASYTALVVEHRTNVSGPISWHRNLQPQIVFCRFFTGADLRSSARPPQQLGSAVPAPRLLLGERPWQVQSIHHPLALCSGVLNIVPRARVGPTPTQFLRSTSRALTWQFIYTPTESCGRGGALNERSVPWHSMKNGERLGEAPLFPGRRSLRRVERLGMSRSSY